MTAREPRRSMRYDRETMYQAHVELMHEICKVNDHAPSIVIYAAHMRWRMRHLLITGELVHPSQFRLFHRRSRLPSVQSPGPPFSIVCYCVCSVPSRRVPECRALSPTNAHWCITNSVLQSLDLPTITKYMKDTSERFFLIADSYPNPFLSAAASCEAPPPSLFTRRPRNIITDPLDDFTIKIKRLREINKQK
ncbi:hypothetical protein EVAR_84644_1 [Eumeta japonica]|uniref:Uncharacterized protein n=1 Tax=Eumeta variegata TaxID=151549 RepID=A0A4C1V002_EUMVA|nr:hypothetical protein EVAR_84644_1 [Eumeta japonica]